MMFQTLEVRIACDRRCKPVRLAWPSVKTAFFFSCFAIMTGCGSTEEVEVPPLWQGSFNNSLFTSACKDGLFIIHVDIKLRVNGSYCIQVGHGCIFYYSVVIFSLCCFSPLSFVE
jgi:hypothetical protein